MAGWLMSNAVVKTPSIGSGRRGYGTLMETTGE